MAFTEFVAGDQLTADMLNTRFPRGIMTAPTQSNLDGTATAANTTEVRDAVLGDYVFTALANRRYRIWYTGGCNAAAADCRYIHRIRDGGASTPTTASTLVAENVRHLGEAGTTGRETMTLSHILTLSAGVHTLSLFTFSPESVALTPVPLGVNRQLYVEDIGPA